MRLNKLKVVVLLVLVLVGCRLHWAYYCAGVDCTTSTRTARLL
jgi:hypothetical protein